MTPHEAAYASAARDLEHLSASEVVRLLLGMRIKRSVRRAFEARGASILDAGLIELKGSAGPWPARLLMVGDRAAWLSVSSRTGDWMHWSGTALAKWAEAGSHAPPGPGGRARAASAGSPGS